MTTADIVVIGPCTVSSCNRAAAQHVVVGDGPRFVAGTVCNECADKSRLAAFLLDLNAA